jgi:hypothetical protein
MNGRMAFAAFAAVVLSACSRTTARLSPEQEKLFAAEGVVRKADDVVFRYTSDPGRRSERWENRRASIVVTHSSLLIHKNEKVGLWVTPRTQKAVAVERTGDRIRIRSGSGRSEEIWSFEPESDAPGWTADIRAVTNPPAPPDTVSKPATTVRKPAKKRRRS